MREWLVLGTENAIVIIDALALLIIVAGTIEAFVGGLRLLLSPPSSQAAAGYRVALRALVGPGFDLPARGGYHRDVHHHELGRCRAPRRRRRYPHLPQLLS